MHQDEHNRRNGELLPAIKLRDPDVIACRALIVFAAQLQKAIDATVRILQAGADATGFNEPPAGAASHSSDFASVNWFGQIYTFTKPQQKVVAALWSAWEQGNPFLSQASLLAVAGSNGLRLRDVFKNSLAWGTVIQHGPRCGGSLGTYRLVEPQEIVRADHSPDFASQAG